MNPATSGECIEGRPPRLCAFGRWSSPRNGKEHDLSLVTARPFVLRLHRFLLGLVLPLAAASSVAQDACAPVFSCTTAKGKKVSVCDAGSDLEYAFGPANKEPEMRLRLPRAKVIAEHDDGIGRFRHFSLGFARGDTSYQVYFGFDVLDLDAPPLGGVTVLHGSQTLADMPCSAKAPIVSKLDALDLFNRNP